MKNSVSTFSLQGEELSRLTQRAEASSWKAALSEAYEVDKPELFQAGAAACLTSWMPLLPTVPRGAALNLDNSLGAVTEGLALHYSRVFHLSLVPEHTSFSKIRLLQDGLSNVDFLNGRPSQLPLQDKAVDVITAINLFPWANHYARKTNKSSLQLETILSRELFRVLRPGGVSLIGVKSPHSRVFWSRSKALRTVLGYYRSLLQQVGFKKVTFYYPRPDFSLPRTIVPVEDGAVLKSLIRERIARNNNLKQKVLNRLAMLAVEAKLLPRLLSHYLILVKKERTDG